MEAVVLDKVTKLFGDFTAVDGVSFTVHKGEIFGFLGPNGSGKSTTIKMICGILKPTDGKIEILGEDSVKKRKYIVGKIGYMSQKFSLYPILTCEENLNFYAGVYGLRGKKKKEKVEKLIKENGISHLRYRLARELPVGWKQRLALACALVNDPEIVFLDEPTGGVDPSSRRVFWDIIIEMARSGATVFVTTHYMDEAEYCDRIGLIYQGKLIALGSSAELKKMAIKGKVFEVSMQDAVSHISAIEAMEKVEEVTIHGRALHVTFAPDVLEPGKILEEARLSGIQIEEWREIQPSLEDVFVTLMK